MADLPIQQNLSVHAAAMCGKQSSAKRRHVEAKPCGVTADELPAAILQTKRSWMEPGSRTAGCPRSEVFDTK
jgi:hypothetical protein